MRYKPTPLNILSTILIGWVVWAFNSKNDPEGWGSLAVFVAISIGLLGFLVDFIVQRLAKKYWLIFSFEIFIITFLFVLDSWSKRTKSLIIPDSFNHTFIATIYQVDGASALPKSFLSWSYKMEVPPNGIILTSSHFDSDLPETNVFTSSGVKLNSETTRKGFIRLTDDTIRCNNKTYKFRSWMIDSAACCGYSTKEIDSFKISLRNRICGE